MLRTSKLAFRQIGWEVRNWQKLGSFALRLFCHKGLQIANQAMTESDGRRRMNEADLHENIEIVMAHMKAVVILAS